MLKRIADSRIIFGKNETARPVQKVFLNNRTLSKRKAESWWDEHGLNAHATQEFKNIFGVSGLVVQYFILCYGRNYLYDDIDRICIFSPDCSGISYKMAHFNQCIFLNAYFAGHDGMCYANVFDLLEG